MMIAASLGNLELVQLLVDNGADINIKDKAGQTAISYASRSGNDSVTSYLGSKGAKPDTGNSSKYTIEPVLLGTWQGRNVKIAKSVCVFVLDSNNHFDFKTRNASNKIIEKQSGTYTVEGNSLILMMPGKAPLTRKWMYSNGLLGIDKIIQLQKID